VILVLGWPGVASANGPCGQNFDGATACHLSFPSTLSGSLITDNESDYYVFSAPRGTELFATLTDTQDPTCSSSSSISCGGVQAELYDSQGDDLGEGTDWSEPNNNITVPRSFGYTLDSAGTYYLVVTGSLGRDSNDNPAPVSYTLDITASPTVQWPRPQPPSPAPTPASPGAEPACIVPHFKVGATLGTVERRIIARHCSVGKIKHRASRHIRRRRVTALRPKPGTRLTNHAAVTITISTGRKHKHHKKTHR
jgi:hypothetical protein